MPKILFKRRSLFRNNVRRADKERKKFKIKYKKVKVLRAQTQLKKNRNFKINKIEWYCGCMVRSKKQM